MREMMRLRLPLMSALAGVLLTAVTPVCAQSVLGGDGPDGGVRLVQTDMASLELQESKKDLPCTVTPVKPDLGFDLRLHTGYEVTIPLKELSGSGGHLTAIFRVTSARDENKPVYFSQQFEVPPIEEDAGGSAELEGNFDVGEGHYHVDWLMRNPAERVCSSHWNAEAALTDSDRAVSLVLPPGEVRATEKEYFREDPPVQRAQNARPLNVKVLVNFAPQKVDSSILRPSDIEALVSILRTLSREPRIGTFSIVAFNLEQQRVIFRQEPASRIDFPALGQAVDSLALGTVDIHRLGEKHGDTKFLSDLIRREAADVGKFDALVFAGPKAMLEENVPPEQLKEIGPVDSPMFYLNYILNPRSIPWRDAIGNIVKFFRGAEYTISRPRDLWSATGQLVSRMVEVRSERQVSGAAGL